MKSQINFGNLGGGGSYPTESVAYVGQNNVNNYYSAINYDDPTSFICGTIASGGSDVTKQFTLCDYVFKNNFTLQITAKTKVKLLAGAVGGTATVTEYTLASGDSVTISRPTNPSSSGAQQGYSVEVYDLG